VYNSNISTVTAFDGMMGVSGCAFFINDGYLTIYKINTANYSIVQNYSFGN
jgi:hypothetical protein